MLREEYGAQKVVETFTISKNWYRKIFSNAKIPEDEFLTSTAGPWDLSVLYECGYTPETQPHREQWRILYEIGLEKWRPHVKLLRTDLSIKHDSEGTEPFTRLRDGLLPKLILMFAKLGERDRDGVLWIEACDDTSIAAEAKVHVEIVNGNTVGKTRKIAK